MTTDAGCETCRWVVPSALTGWPAWMPRAAFRPGAPRAPWARPAVGLDGFFGVHPALAPLLPAWQAGHWAIVHACGAPDESRSHFQAMELMERGLTDLHGPASGWISRHLASFDTGNASPLRAVGIGGQVPRSLRGGVPASALQSIADSHPGGAPDSTARLQAALASLYGGGGPPPPGGGGALCAAWGPPAL